MGQSCGDSLRQLIAEVGDLRICAPDADYAEIWAFTSSCMYLVVKLQGLASPLLPPAESERLAGIDVKLDDWESALRAMATIDALAPDIETAADRADELKVEMANTDPDAGQLGALHSTILHGICDVLGDTELGLTGREIGGLLTRCSIVDPCPTASKRHRLHEALARSQSECGLASRVISFVLEAMNPASYAAHDPGVFEVRRSRLNKVLAFGGLFLSENGKLTRVEQATTLPKTDDTLRDVEQATEGLASPTPPVNLVYVEHMVGSNIHQGLPTSGFCSAGEGGPGTEDLPATGSGRGAGASLTDGQASDYHLYDYKTTDKFGFPGVAPVGKTDVVAVNGAEVKLRESSFELLLRLAVELSKREGGWVNSQELQGEGFAVSEADHRAWLRLRKDLRGFLLGSEPKETIENNGSKSYRVSTHPDFITYDKEKLLVHPSHRVRSLAEQLP